MLSDMLSPPRVECVDGAGAGAGTVERKKKPNVKICNYLRIIHKMKA